jgi:hypothetical protein
MAKNIVEKITCTEILGKLIKVSKSPRGAILVKKEIGAQGMRCDICGELSPIRHITISHDKVCEICYKIFGKVFFGERKITPAIRTKKS